MGRWIDCVPPTQSWKKWNTDLFFRNQIKWQSESLSIKMAGNYISVITEPLRANPFMANVLMVQALWHLKRVHPCSITTCMWMVVLLPCRFPAQDAWLRLDSWCLKWVLLGTTRALLTGPCSQCSSPHLRKASCFSQLLSTSYSLSVYIAYSFTESRLSKK